MRTITLTLFLFLFQMVAMGMLISGCTRHEDRKSQYRLTDSVDIARDCYLRARDQYSYDNVEGSLALLDSSLALDPSNANAWACKGSSLARLKRHAEAQDAYERSLAINPKAPSVLWHRAADCAVSGNKERTLFFLQQAIDLDTNYKQWSMEDDCFKGFWQDKDFLKIIQ
jgi:tetratricopeptide (TPR) repeat protein